MRFCMGGWMMMRMIERVVMEWKIRYRSGDRWIGSGMDVEVKMSVLTTCVETDWISTHGRSILLWQTIWQTAQYLPSLTISIPT